MSRQFRSDDTDKWKYGFGDGSLGNGSINTSTDDPIDSACSGTTGTTSLTATNASFASGQLVLIHQTRGTGAGNWELNRIASYTAGTITLSHSLQNTYTNSGASVAQVLVMKQYNDLTINSGQTLTAKAWNGTVGGIIAYFVKGTLQGQSTGGTISLNGLNGITTGGGGNGIGFRGGASSTGAAQQGEGTNGAGGSTSTAANGNGGGGAAGDSKQGNGGGNGGTGEVGGLNTGTGGSTSGNAGLTVATFGGGGGGGGRNASDRSGGGGGGGIAFLFCSNIDLTYLTINSKGGDGPSYWAGGGGGGGSCLLKCKTAVLGTNKVVATGGLTPSSYNTSSGRGGTGRIHLDYKTSYTGTTNPTLDATNDITLDYPSAGGAFLYNLI